MNRLLVSVRSAEECAILASHEVDLIDIKEPAKGSLGAADAAAVRDVVRINDGAVPVSVALGELRVQAERAPLELNAWRGISYAKLGLADCGGWAQWPTALQRVWRSWPTYVSRVAVAYADDHLARSPNWQEVLPGRAAQLRSCAAC